MKFVSMGGVEKKLSSAQIIIIGFAAVILTGTLLLMLPFAARSGHSATFLEALFTATSATCVTGLIVQDTATYWSGFGQAVILCLIQIGGMGVVTVALSLFIVSGRKINLKERSIMQDSVSAHKVGGIIRHTRFIIRMIVLFEAAGALLMAPVFCREFSLGKGLWYTVFHSISAFCNAGFDLMGAREKYSSLTSFSAHPLINIVVMLLIVIGGIGFLTWEDVRTNKWKFHKYRMQSKVILTTSALLIVLPAIYFFFAECHHMPMRERIWQSLFQSVTTRTAGFNTADLTAFSEGGIAIMIILMLIGGSPGSTAGGMKTTTFAVILSTMISVFLRREHTQFHGRRVEEDAVRNAIGIFTLYMVLFLTGGIIISRVEHLPLLTCLFETGSAVGTVGLTLGITPTLGTVSRIILIVLMYTGRVGGLTLIFSAMSAHRGHTARLPQEKLTVG